MGQQVSVEDAFPVYRERCSELFDENLLLRSQVAALERKIAAAREENARLLAAAQEPVTDGPDLAAQPPYPERGRG